MSSESYTFGNLPVGAYTLQGTRLTVNADGTTTSSSSLAAPATVALGLTTTVNFSF